MQFIDPTNHAIIIRDMRFISDIQIYTKTHANRQKTKAGTHETKGDDIQHISTRDYNFNSTNNNQMQNLFSKYHVCVRGLAMSVATAGPYAPFELP